MAQQSGDMETLDRDVRVHVLATAAQTATIPGVQQIADALRQPRPVIEDALRRLAAGRVLVLAPGNVNVWMANPFSAFPTPFRVYAKSLRYYGNCIWDSLGIPAALGADARIVTPCGDCDEEMVLEVRNGALVRNEGMIHFGVPAARWWDNIGYT